jgi:hypothetical protein
LKSFNRRETMAEASEQTVQGAPDTLPADFFKNKTAPVAQTAPVTQGASQEAPDTLPSDFFSKQTKSASAEKTTATPIGLSDSIDTALSTNPMYQTGKAIYKGARGLYHGAVGDEETAASKGKPSGTAGSPNNPAGVANYGLTPAHVGHELGSATRSIGEFGAGVAKDLGVGGPGLPAVVPNEKGVGVSDPKANTLLGKYVMAPSQAEREQSKNEFQKYFETNGAEAAGHAISGFIHGTLGEYVPAVGPIASTIMQQAANGDIGGALAQILALYGTEEAAGKIKEGIKGRVDDLHAKLTPDTPEIAQAKANVESLAKDREVAQKAHDKAAAEHQKHAASHAQGVASPDKVTKALAKSKLELDEATFHHESAIEHAKQLAASQPNLAQRAGTAVGKTIAKVLPTPEAPAEIPAEKIEAAPQEPVLQKLGQPKPAAPPINVKTPGQVQPETFPQEPTETPRTPIGRIQLPNEQGTVGTPRQLTEGTPEGPQVPPGGLPKIKPVQEVLPPEKPAPKPERGNVKALTVDEKGNVIDKENTPEMKLQKLLEESLKNNTETKPAPAAKTADNYDKSKDMFGTRDKLAYDEAMEKRAAEGGKTRVEGAQDRRQEEVPVAEERRTGDRRNAAGVRVDENGDPVMSPDVQGHWQQGVFGEKPAEDIGAKARAENPEPTRAETKAAALPKEEPIGYTPKAEPVVKAGEEGRTPAKSAEEYHPAVEQRVSELSDENLKKLAQAHGLNPDEYDFKARDDRRHRVERDQLAKDVVDQMGEDEKINLGRAAENLTKEPGFDNKDQSSKGRADRAAKLFPRLRGPVDEFGNATASGGSQGATGYSQKADQRYPATAKSEPLDVAKHADDYNKAEGREALNPEKVEKSPRAEEIAKEYESMKHDPSNPEVKKSYDALIDDTKKQWEYATDKMGIKIEPVAEDPYKSYDEMRDDVKNNKRLKVFTGGNELPADHPLAEVDPQTGESYNTMFRAVHDLFGHAAKDNDFSENGEENAWNTHRQMMSPEAVPAMTTETRGQTSWFFNHGEEPGKFAEQKAGILPDFANESTPDAKGALNHIKSGKDFAVLTAENPNNTRASVEDNAKRNRELAADLRKKGYDPISVEGHTKDVEGEKEHSYLVKDIKPEEAAELGKKHDQAAVLTTEGLHDLKTNKVNPSDNAKLLTGEEARKQPYYTRVGDQDFSVPIDFDKTVEPGTKTEKPGSAYTDRGNGLHEVVSGPLTNRVGHLLAHDVEGDAGKVQVASHWVSEAERGKGIGAQQLETMAQSLPDSKKTLVSDDEMTGSAKKAWDKFQSQYPDAVTKNGDKYSVDLAKMRGEELPKVSGGSPAAGAGAAKQKALPKVAEEHLTEEERAGVTKTDAGRAKFVENLKRLPSLQEFTDIAKAGEGGRKWYQRSAAAFDALTEEAPKYFKDGDRQKFTDFLAALSPQQSVKMNLGEALNAWTKYVDEGRPTGKPLEKLLKDELTLSGAKIPNATKALAGEPLWPDLSKNSNFKVPSFAKNLNGYLNHVTNDGWQALFGGLEAKEIAKANSYHPLAVMTRAAADALGWSGAEAQAAIWAFTKTFTEKGETLPEDVRRRSEDFADILALDPEIRQQLAQLGVNHEQLDAKLRAIGKKPPVTPGASPTTENSIGKLKSRIETARGKGTIPPPKSGSLNFGDDEDEAAGFDPTKFRTQTDEPLEKLGKKSRLGSIK